MNLIDSEIKPFYGIDDISFDMTYDDMKELLKANKIKYQVEIYPNKGCDPEVAWTLIRIDKGITVYFALNKMFKICFEESYKGKLANGIFIGMAMEDAISIDSSLEYNDDEEDYESELGYWVEDDLDTNRIMRITIFIKEVLDEEVFFTYDWTRN